VTFEDERADMKKLADLLLQYVNFKGDEQELGDAGDIYAEAADLARKIFASD